MRLKIKNPFWQLFKALLILGSIKLLYLLYIFVGWYFVLSTDYNQKVFTNEIKKDDRMEKLLSIESNAASEGVYHIIIELKDGKKIGGQVDGSIYKFRELQIIDRYNIYTSFLHHWQHSSEWDAFYYKGISTYRLEKLLNKSSGYFETDLNKFIDAYDEIKELAEKLYNNPIPGAREGIIMNMSEWGDEEELKKYIAYVSELNGYRSKIYIEVNND
ncbi:hypothetical protein AGMMS49579_19830 [Spirochaetia bacterium]|nr:hypothetical protein AGMMS49579_19830 [Spirochaetia bacterium]